MCVFYFYVYCLAFIDVHLALILHLDWTHSSNAANSGAMDLVIVVPHVCGDNKVRAVFAQNKVLFARADGFRLHSIFPVSNRSRQSVCFYSAFILLHRTAAPPPHTLASSGNV